jgi:hypothetical protein
MRFLFYSCLGLLFWQACQPALAEDGKALPRDGMAVSPDGHAMVSPTVCARLPSPMAGPDYVPGVDVHGNKVAPADLPGPGQPEIDALPIILRHGVAGVGRRGGLVVGQVTVRDGRAYFNGAPLASDDQAAIAAACRNAGP